jgi:hypothetical protein
MFICKDKLWEDRPGSFLRLLDGDKSNAFRISMGEKRRRLARTKPNQPRWPVREVGPRVDQGCTLRLKVHDAEHTHLWQPVRMPDHIHNL